MKIDIIAGARPNFMKIAPIIHALENKKINTSGIIYRLVHTGQHFDKAMSEQFFHQLSIPEPHYNLGAGGGTQAEQTSKIMIGYEKLLMKKPVDLVMVVGDVTSTMACSIVAKKSGLKVAHVEAGIRSGDITMPEEINRIVTDSLADYFFTTTKSASKNLLKSGAKPNQIYFVGNTMIDTLLANLPKLRKPTFWTDLQLKEKSYIIATLHRPSNVDDFKNLNSLLHNISNFSGGIPLIFPIHPRTKSKIPNNWQKPDNLHFVEPQGYLEFNYLVKKSLGVVTDSGGITEETTVLGVPCITLRTSTERPETVKIGTNVLIGNDMKKLKIYMKKMTHNQWKKGAIPELWDGKCAIRIVKILNQLAINGIQ
jgi:UDP-N-acetylglucosamine 2-epimerase (non-hydrolysing)